MADDVKAIVYDDYTFTTRLTIKDEVGSQEESTDHIVGEPHDYHHNLQSTITPAVT